MTRIGEFEELRPLLFSIAYRILGSVSEAEDALQETWLRYQASPARPVSAKAFLSVTVTRVSIDVLRSARARRESYVGTWFPEPLLDDPYEDPERSAELADSLSMAALVLLERLSPLERAVFVLREVFGFDFAEVASAVERSEAACRQLAVRARRHVDACRPRFEADRQARDLLAARFFDALGNGSVDVLRELLAADLELAADGGGKAPALIRSLFGIDEVARALASIPTLLDPIGVDIEPRQVNGQPGAFGRPTERDDLGTELTPWWRSPPTATLCDSVHEGGSPDKAPEHRDRHQDDAADWWIELLPPEPAARSTHYQRSPRGYWGPILRGKVVPTPEEEQIDANIALLLSLQLDGLSHDPAAQQALTDSINKIKSEYLEAKSKAGTSKYYNDVCASIAKSLPSLVKGTKDAADAFKKGDYISGSAALMDICASVIPVFASLSAAGGPAGALLGAIFSVVGQILSFFAPQQPSLEEKIQKMLDHLKSEDEIESITAFGHSVSSYTSTLRRKSAGVHRMGNPVAVPGTVSLTQKSKVVTGTGTTFIQSCGVGQWLTFGPNGSGMAYKIATIDSDTRLTLATDYEETPTASSTVQQRSRLVDRRGIAEILAMPLTTETEADDFRVAMKGLEWGLETNQWKLDEPVFENWKVAAYLEREGNWGKEGWPEVLGV